MGEGEVFRSASESVFVCLWGCFLWELKWHCFGWEQRDSSKSLQMSRYEVLHLTDSPQWKLSMMRWAALLLLGLVFHKKQAAAKMGWKDPGFWLTSEKKILTLMDRWTIWKSFQSFSNKSDWTNWFKGLLNFWKSAETPQMFDSNMNTASCWRKKWLLRGPRCKKPWISNTKMRLCYSSSYSPAVANR